MYMPLIATEDGVPQFVKQPGVSLEPGDILGILTLDDPARVKHAKPFEGQLPVMGLPLVVGSKPHQKLEFYIDILNNILDGFDNQAMMSATVKDLVTVLHDPELPFSTANAILSTLSGRMPAKLEESIRSAIELAKSKAGTLEFPAARIKKLMDNFLNEQVRQQDRPMVRQQLAALFDLVENFKNGLKGHEWSTIANLLRRFEATERLFGGNIEARVLELREQHKNELSKVASLVLSHMKAANKSKLVLALLDLVKSSGSTYSSSETVLNDTLKGLAALDGRFVLFLHYSHWI